MGTVLGGAAGLGARLTGSLHTIVEKLSRAIAPYRAPYGMQLGWYGSAHGSALVDVRRGLHLTFREGFKEGGMHALRMN